jgi:hypothetical protein
MPALPAMRERPLGDDQPEHLLLLKPETEKAVDRDNRQPALDHLGEFGVGTCGPGIPMASRRSAKLDCSLTLSPKPVVGGNEVTGTVTLDCDAAPQDLAVALSSTKPAIAQPTVTSLLFPVGTKTLMFSISTSSVNATTSATINASAKGISKGKKLTVTVP